MHNTMGSLQTIDDLDEIHSFLQDSVGPEGDIGYDDEGAGIDDVEGDEFEGGAI